MERLCPHCKKCIDDLTGVRTDTEPRPGDICVCLYCGAVLRVNLDLSVRKMTGKEIDRLPTNSALELAAVVAARDRVAAAYKASSN